MSTTVTRMSDLERLLVFWREWNKELARAGERPNPILSIEMLEAFFKYENERKAEETLRREINRAVPTKMCSDYCACRYCIKE